jgi:hypothetical protein
MPPPGHRPQITGRPNIIRRDKSNPINNNINTPPPDLLYPIVNETPPPPPTPLQPSEDKILRTIDREARMKQNQLDREARKREREERIKPNVFLPPNNIKNDIITPPPDNFKNEIIVPPQGDLKTPDDSTTLKSSIKNDKNIYLIGGAALVAFLVIAMNKR